MLTGKRTYNLPRDTVRDLLVPIIELPHLRTAHKRLYRRVVDLYVRYPRLSYVDAYHAALAERATPPGLYSFDTDFDVIPTVERSSRQLMGE